jgi:NTE family protein
MIPADRKDMGADIIIAINVGPPLGPREDIEALPGMLNQIVAVGMIQSDRRNLQLADLVITPPLDKYKIIDFTEVDAISALGYEAADQYAAALQKYALSDADWEGHLAARKAKQLVAIPVAVEMEVKGTKQPNAKAIAKDLENNIGNAVNPSVLGSQLSEIRGRPL